MITKREFCEVISKLKQNDDFLNDLCDVFRKHQREDQVYSTGLEDVVVNLLELIFDDKENQWIAYWIWECNYGETYEDGDVTESDGTPIPLKTAKELYNFLIENMERKND